jgi:glutaminase
MKKFQGMFFFSMLSIWFLLVSIFGVIVLMYNGEPGDVEYTFIISAISGIFMVIAALYKDTEK